MKSFIFVFILFYGLSALSDSFELIKDGKKYVCTQQNEPPDNGGVVECGKKAYAGPFTKDESIQLCSGATDTSPADCGIKAYADVFTKSEAIALCTGTVNKSGPADCGKKAYAGPFSKSESVSLCSKTGTLKTAECAISAHNGPYTKEEAIRLCRTNSILILRSLKLIEQSNDIQLQIRSIQK